MIFVLIGDRDHLKWWFAQILEEREKIKQN